MKAIYAGSFDPFTIGHEWIAGRALEIFDSLVIAIGINESKKNERSIEARIEKIRTVFKDNPRVEVVSYKGLTAELAKSVGAGVLVRGVRNSIDFEKEKELADINLEILGVPTVMIPSPPSLSYISSSMVRELSHFGEDISRFEP